MPMHAGNSEYTDFMRFMNQSENSQQSITAWNEFTGETTEQGAAATASTSAQDADWIRDFEDHKVQQGKIGFLTRGCASDFKHLRWDPQLDSCF